ncbi:MAG: hypothetical protein SFT81_03925 [Candidatus Caenarcaniphilales bacterium]|nr:hypothetical protein [Candidatus Caenarcaniphilales bacterium]
MDFPSARIAAREARRERIRQKKKLSDTLPGTGLAKLLVEKKITKDKSEPKKKSEAKRSKPPLPLPVTDTSSKESLPSWSPRDWVTREGERLIVKSKELVREEQFGNLDSETSYGVIPPEKVNAVLARIRETLKKKNTGTKKGTDTDKDDLETE